MDLLRRLFGLQPATNEQDAPPAKPPVDLEGPTAPLNQSPFRQPPVVPLPAESEESKGASVIPDDLYTTDLLEDNDDGGFTRRLDDKELTHSQEKIANQVILGIHSDPGQVRSNNQDSCFSFMATSVSVDDQPNFGLFIVADGMGGHHDGEKASSVAGRSVVDHITNNIYLPMLIPQDSNAERPTITEILRQAIQEANENVSAQVPDGGTTLTAAAIMGDLAYIAHVGDSRAYLINGDKIEQLTRDHSLVQRLIELDQLTPEEAVDHPQRNVLYRALGQNETIDVDAITRRLPPGSRLLICSDGLWNMVPDDEIKNTVFSSGSPQAACESLVKLANSRGGPDNITVIIVRMPEPS